MKKRIIYEKSGRLRFIGHLDFMRTMHRSLRRASIPIAYSKGFHPHPLMSFAAPLALGWIGLREVMEIELEDEWTNEQLRDALQKNVPDGISILAAEDIPENSKSVMGLVEKASYRIELPESFSKPLQESLLSFLNRDEILIQKTGKIKGRKTLVHFNAAPHIFEVRAVKEPGFSMELTLSAGSSASVKPDALLHAFYREEGREDLIFTELIIRQEFILQGGERP